MKVRMIIECDGKDVGRFLGVMPQRAAFTITKMNEEPKLGPVGKMVLDELHPKKKRGHGRTPRFGRRMKDVILDEVTKGPRKTSELVSMLVGVGFRRDSVSGRLWEMVHREKTIRNDHGTYHLAGSLA